MGDGRSANAFSPSEEVAVRAAGFCLAFTRVQMTLDLVEAAAYRVVVRQPRYRKPL